MVNITGSGGQVIVTVNPLASLHSLTGHSLHLVTETEQDCMRLPLLQYHQIECILFRYIDNDLSIEMNFGPAILTCKTISYHFQSHDNTNSGSSVMYDHKILSTRITIGKKNDQLKYLN